MHARPCNIQRGVLYTLPAESLLYGTQTERGCWSQYTPGYQAEPIIISRYIIALYGECVIYTVREYFHLRYSLKVSGHSN